MTLDDVMEKIALSSINELRAAIEAYANERVARVCAEQMEAYAEGRVKAEREACAKACDDIGAIYQSEVAVKCARAIRAGAQEE